MTFKSKIRKRLANVVSGEMYSAEDIVKLGVILNTNFKPSRDRVYRLIKLKQIATVNMGTDTQPRWYVQGSDLIKYATERYLQE